MVIKVNVNPIDIGDGNGYPPEPIPESHLYDAFDSNHWIVEAFYENLESADQAALQQVGECRLTGLGCAYF